MLEGLDPAAIIALCAVLTVFSIAFNMLLSPLKEKQTHLEKGQIRFEADLKELRVDVKALQNGQSRLENKLDLLLDKKTGRGQEE